MALQEYCLLCGASWQSKDVWWALPVPRDEDGVWGFLYMCPRGHAHFDTSETPSPEAVASRTHCREHVAT